MAVPTHLVIVDQPTDLLKSDGSRFIVTAKDYINNAIPSEVADKPNLRVINLCNDYRYLRTGYYCSLLAEARGHRCIPSASDLVHTNRRLIHKLSLPELESVLKDADAPDVALADEHGVVFFFGRTDVPELTRFGRRLLDLFRLPLMRVTFVRRNQTWRIRQVNPLKLGEVKDKTALFNEAISKYTGSFWNRRRHRNDKYWLAILYDPAEPLPPSNKRALDKFIRIGRRKRFFVELITRANLDSLLEYDALFIRETTSVANPTYRFAQKAEREGIPCVDDTTSILRCCNKIYLHELLRSKRIRTPRTHFVGRHQKDFDITEHFDFPVVLKVPDGSFSQGVFKVNSVDEFNRKKEEIFKDSELLLIQEFFPSDYDWRITLIGGKPLFACKYYMAKAHWQIYNHQAKGSKEGDAECVPLDKVPEAVLHAAIRAAGLIGKGLYGVDIKEVDKKAYVIEINDNPNIDAGVEDKILGDKLYEAIFDHFQRLIDAE